MEHLRNLNPGNSGFYVLLSIIHVADGRWYDAAKVRIVIEGTRFQRTPRCSLAKVNGRVYKFVVGVD